MSGASKSTESEADLLEKAIAGSQEALDRILEGYRGRLRRMVSLRMDRHLQARVDASDVIQEAFIDTYARFPEYTKNRPAPFFLWVRYLTRQRLLMIHRQHLGAQARDPRREVSLDEGRAPLATSESLAAALLGSFTSPSQQLIRDETRAQVQEALGHLEPLDREIVALRHFEQLSNGEAAQELGISEAAASKRYIRAVQHLHGVLILVRGQGREESPTA